MGGLNAGRYSRYDHVVSSDNISLVRREKQ